MEFLFCLGPDPWHHGLHYNGPPDEAVSVEAVKKVSGHGVAAPESIPIPEASDDIIRVCAPAGVVIATSTANYHDLVSEHCT